ncbi:AAA domain-containing protein [Pseudescherichia sp.]|uniref:AAA domain-containing protein n=1 Tax=Pseudescherichia sp. TaxID=2055881 RepID=UPI0028997AA1|nr:AAA domain-containing protein [Pseudescherichia sp.]
MDSNTSGFAAYWRNSLADAEFGKGTFERKDVGGFTQWNERSSGRLSEEIVSALFTGERDDVKTVDVVLRPKVYFQLIKHGKERTAGAPEVITPLVTSAVVNREGFLFPTPATSIPRDLLEPLPKGALSIGEISCYDRYKTTHPSFSASADEFDADAETDEQRQARHARYYQSWQHYLDDAGALLKAVAGPWLANPEQYEPADYGYLVKKTQPGGASFHILALYDHLLVSQKDVPLFKRFAARENVTTEPLLSSGAKFSERLGHSGDRFPLAEAQRDALSHFLESQEGDILAVNGPPGTGKTTLLLSIIATQWARAALEQGEPPVIVATSTNNQAVTNIIEAFGKDFATGTGPMAGRWLPEVKSFGAYFPSRSRNPEATKKYQTEDFFRQVESKEYVEDAQAFYLSRARAAFPDETCDSPETVVKLLHGQLKAQEDKLTALLAAWKTLNEARKKRAEIDDDIVQYLADKAQLLTAQAEEIETLTSVKTEWDDYRAKESLLYSLCSWIPAIRSKRFYMIKQRLEPKLKRPMEGSEWTDPNAIEGTINALRKAATERRDKYQQQIDKAQTALLEEHQAEQTWQTHLRGLGYNGSQTLSFAQADELADTQVRFPAFLLTTHYWEGRWLMDMAKIRDTVAEQRKNGAIAVTARWQRRMKLTPCVVMTCYMLPASMKVFENKGDKGWEANYLYGFADLLIVDEAGQVLPEVAAASFALAKKALVIGDTKQIPPIWNILPAIDMGNMLAGKLLPGATQDEIAASYAAVAQTGKSAASGSVMRVAQLASRYQYDPELERGMYLYEHRRCFDDIIGYCNALCYHGKLQPKREDKSSTLLPAMGYLHIDGKGELASSGSRYNMLEADTLAAWLLDNRERIESHYRKPIQQVVGIVTPFSAQVSTIKRALGDHGLFAGSEENTLTVGTVHSLQGAERAIVIFSPVYSKHEDGGFIDSDSSMLNVAVSRAKDSFLVFGDMDLFEVQPASSPRGLLKKYLFADEENALSFAYKKRKDLETRETRVYTLHGVEQHDSFLNQTLEKADKQITIVSPWLTWQKLEETGFLASMLQARERGINVTVITDKSYNTADKDYEKRKEKQQNLTAALEQLKAVGIATRLVDRVHSKIVIGDDGLLCIGSFNWFSATREAKYEKYDTSMVYDGGNLKREIEAINSSLAKRQA